MKAKKILAVLACALLPYAGLTAGGFQTGLFNSLKGFGLCMDHPATPDIINSYMLYADMYGVLDGRICSPGVKLVYLHQNRLLAFDAGEAQAGLFIAPGVSTGIVYNSDPEFPGLLTAACLSVSLRFSFTRRIEIETGFFTELGFISRRNEYGTSIQVYDNGYQQSYSPHIKLMYRFR